MSIRYSLVPHGGDWREARIAQIVDEQIHPCISRHVYSRPGPIFPLRRAS